VNERRVILRRAPLLVPTAHPYMNGDTLVPLEAGNTLNWTFAGFAA
jgi:dihydroorotase